MPISKYQKEEAVISPSYAGKVLCLRGATGETMPENSTGHTRSGDLFAVVVITRSRKVTARAYSQLTLFSLCPNISLDRGKLNRLLKDTPASKSYGDDMPTACKSEV